MVPHQQHGTIRNEKVGIKKTANELVITIGNVIPNSLAIFALKRRKDLK